MSAPDARDVIAEALCRRDEGWMVADYLPDADGVLDALTEQGFAVVRLPEPDHRCDACSGWRPDGTLHQIVGYRLYRTVSVEESTDEPMTPDQARGLGASLLAAAAYAEAGVRDE